MSDHEEFLGRTEAAELLQISTRTLDRYVRSRKLTLFRSKGKLLFRKTDLSEFKEGREAQTPFFVPTSAAIVPEAADPKYRILWEAAKEELEKKEGLLREMHQRLGFLESELQHSVPLLEAQNYRSELTEDIERQKHEIKALEQKYRAARLGRITAFVFFGGVLLIVLIWFALRGFFLSV